MVRYYTLLARDDGEPWRIEFGDYDVHTVEGERRDFLDSNPMSAAKVIRTDDDQAAIEDIVYDLNLAEGLKGTE